LLAFLLALFPAHACVLQSQCPQQRLAQLPAKQAAAALATLTNQLPQPLLVTLQKQQQKQQQQQEQQQAKILQDVQLPPQGPAAPVALQPQQQLRGSISRAWCCLGAAWI
jgi:ABC-type polar amino acid transport system ATPase subunit